MKFRKKPVIIEAVQWMGQNSGEIQKFTGRDNSFISQEGKMMIKTLEGSLTATKNDWIIKGIRGEFYPCKPDIFEATYEKVQD